MTNDCNFRAIIGTVKFNDFEKFKEWFHSEGYKWDEDKWKDIFYPEQKIVGGCLTEILNRLYSEQCKSRVYYNFREESPQEKAEKISQKVNEQISKIENFLQRLEELQQPLNLFYKHDEYCLVGSSKPFYAIPTKFLDITLLKDYSNLPISSLKQLAHSIIENSESEESLATISLNDIKSEAEQKTAKVEQLKQEIEDVKRGKDKELAELRAEIEAKQAELEQKKQALMTELEQKKNELERQKMKLEVDIFFLESEIYSIRCYLGEVVNFIKVRDGKTCKKEEPIVLFQKLRFLDEEMGKLVSIYNFDGEDLDKFEKAIKYRDDIFEDFCPSNRCVSLVKVSRTGRQFFPDDKCANLLKDYETFHGQQIGILVRDNENLYIGWTDQEMISVKEDFFYTPKTVIVDPDDSKEDKYAREKSQKELFNDAMKQAKEVVSRRFIFSILQGICENESAFLQIPDESKPLTVNSKAIVFSAADNWLTNNRYGSFQDIVDKCNSQVSLRDRVLTTQRLTPSYSQYSNRNDRGRGYADRTHDCTVKDCEIYPINFMESRGMKTRCEYQDKTGTHTWTTVKDKEDSWHFVEGTVILWEEDFEEFDYFVSVEKQWSNAGARSNFQVYKDEFINLQYMNSEWLLYAINNRNLGGWEVGGKEVDYTYAVPYLRKALDYVQKREVEEKELISKYLDLSGINDWMVKLSEWKLSHKVRWITNFQAKRFAKSIQS